MAPFSQHRDDCIRFLGRGFDEVHRWLDDQFRVFGPLHRHSRHHRQGVNEAVEIFGEEVRWAAVLHVLRDCRHIPDATDYDFGIVDPLGLKRSWSTAAYIRYNDENFEELVREHLRPSALMLWAFLGWEDVKTLLSSATTYAEEDINALEAQWQSAHRHLKEDGPLDSGRVTPDAAFSEITEGDALTSDVREHFADVLRRVESEVIAEGTVAKAGYISVDVLMNAFVYLDYELLEDLKPELAGSSPVDVVRFALPVSVTTHVNAVGDASQKSVTFVSRQKAVAVSNVRLRATPNGTEVSYLIGTNSTGIVVGEFGDRFLMRNGIHRAYLLAQMGLKRIPCILLVEKNSVPYLSSSYPTFTPGVLVQPRPPMLVDFMRPELCLQAPVRRTNRLIRISAEEMSIPVD